MDAAIVVSDNRNNAGVRGYIGDNEEMTEEE